MPTFEEAWMIGLGLIAGGLWAMWLTAVFHPVLMYLLTRVF